MPDHFWWYLSRSTGMVTLIASGLSIMWGLLLSTRLIRKRSLPKWLLDLHRFLGAIAVVFLAVHLGALLADSYVKFSVLDMLIPFHASWKPGALAWGIVAMWFLIAIEATSLLKNRMPRRIWHRIHLMSFPMFAASLTHAATAGTDVSNRGFVAVAYSMSVMIVFLTIYRIGAKR